MRPLILFLFSVVLLFSSSAASAQVPVAPVPSWVTLNELPYARRGLEDKARDGYIDVAFERQVSLAARTSFVRLAKRVLTEAGVENAAEVSISYDPSYQRIHLHSLRIVRDGKVLDRLRTARFGIIQEETERSKHIYNGQLTAVHNLEDVRKGDLIEYSYSVVGTNPVFGGRYASILDTRFDVPVYHLYYKVLVPAGRSLQVRTAHDNVEPRRSQGADGSVYEWSLSDRQPFKADDQTPGWYDAFPAIHVSEYASWAEVNEWATAQFPFGTPEPSVAKLAATLRQQHPAAEDQAVAAIRFVQDEVRYLGIEMGASSHRPHSPGQVLGQRFGDCKDKSYLLCTLLRALGFEAWPVLTASDFRRGIKEWLPSPFAFDHCTVHARINGQSLWIDPTIAGQRGRLGNIAYPDYQVGLVIRPGTNALTDVALQDKGKVAVKETIRLGSLKEPARLRVVTEYTGSFADDMRSEVRGSNKNDVLEDRMRYYKYHFEKIHGDSIRFADDEAANRFTVYEDYTITDAWDDDHGKRRFLIAPYVIGSYTRKPEKGPRTMPFALSYPAQVTEDVEVELPEAWDADSDGDHFEAPGFRFTSRMEVSGKRVACHYTYEATQDHVAAADVEQYLKVYEQMEDNEAYRISYGDTDGGERIGRKKETYKPLNMEDVYPLLYVLLGVAVFATWVVRRNRRGS